MGPTIGIICKSAHNSNHNKTKANDINTDCASSMAVICCKSMYSSRPPEKSTDCFNLNVAILRADHPTSRKSDNIRVVFTFAVGIQVENSGICKIVHLFENIEMLNESSGIFINRNKSPRQRCSKNGVETKEPMMSKLSIEVTKTAQEPEEPQLTIAT